MKGAVVALDRLGGRRAAALIVDGALEDFLIDPPEDAPPAPGAILRGVAGRPMKGMGGVFVELPEGRGFLRQAKGLRPGAALTVQVAARPEPGKAVPVTPRLLFKSRYAIVTPDAPGLNIARGITDPDIRAALAGIAEEAMAGAAHGLILRSAAALADADAIRADIAAMRARTDAVLADACATPALLVAAPDAHHLAWRDWTDPWPDTVADAPGSFVDHGVSERLDALLRPETPLPGGAMMAIEPTRAMVAVDVNTGGDGSPAAGLKANIAAARALPRALRLRGLGGQVVIDFAPMPKKDRQTLDQTLKAAFRRDGTETTLAGWTPLGNYELQRKRDRVPLAEALAGVTW